MEINEPEFLELLMLPLYTDARLLLEISNQKYSIEYLSQLYARLNQKFILITSSNTELLQQIPSGTLPILFGIESLGNGGLEDLCMPAYRLGSLVAALELPVPPPLLAYFDIVIWYPHKLLPQPVSIYIRNNLRPNLSKRKVAIETCHLDPKLRSQMQESYFLLRELEFKYKEEFVPGFFLGDLEMAERVCRALAMANEQLFCLPRDAKNAVLVTCLKNLNLRKIEEADVEQIMLEVGAAIQGVAGW